MRRFNLRPAALLVTMLLAGAMPASAEPVDDYLAIRIAEELNLVCQALKHVEASYLPGLAQDYLAQTDQGVAYANDLIDSADFTEWQQGLDADAKAKASELGCTEAASSYLLSARAAASQKIYQGLLLAFHFNSADSAERFRKPLTQAEMQAAGSYDSFLQQVYGGSFGDFVARQKQAASQLLPKSAFAPPVDPNADWGDVGLQTLLSTIYSADDIEAINDAQFEARWAIDHIALEVFAETNGWLVWSTKTPDGGLYGMLKRPDSDAAPIPIWSDVATYPVGQGRSLSYVLAHLPDGRIRTLTFGDGSSDLGADATVRLYIPKAVPEGWTGYGYFDQQAFRDDAQVFDAKPVSGEPCLGGPCYDFDPGASGAALAYGEKNIIELFISAKSGAEPPPVSETPARAGAIYVSGLARIAR